MNILDSLYEHQKKAIEQLGNGKILVGGVGSGKSRTALAYFWKYETDRMCRPKPLYIITTARKRDSKDWTGEAIYFGITDDPKHAEESACPLIVDSWNNLHKYVEVKNAFFIFDEQRVVGYGSWTKNFLKICKGNRWILLSATPGDVWSDYIPVFIANGFYRNKTEFIARHVIYSRYTKYPKVERYIDEGKLEAYKQRILVDMPFSRRTSSRSILTECPFDNHSLLRVYRGRWNIFEGSPIKNAGEWCYLLRRVVNEDRSRLEACLDIFEQKKRVIIFYNFDYELKILKDGFTEYLLGSSTPISEYNGHRHDELPEGDSWVYIVQYNSASEAWNCITTDTIIFYSLNYSYKIMEQAAGRTNRMNTPYNTLYYYVLYSKSIIDKSILTALKNKRTFSEYRMYSKTFDS